MFGTLPISLLERTRDFLTHFSSIPFAHATLRHGGTRRDFS
jgi:hypothetical protein